MRNGIGRLSLEEQKNAQVGLRIYVLRIDGYGSLELRNGQGRLLLAKVAMGFLDVGRKLLLFVSGYLRETYRRCHYEREYGRSELR